MDPSLDDRPTAAVQGGSSRAQLVLARRSRSSTKPDFVPFSVRPSAEFDEPLRDDGGVRQIRFGAFA